jgi:ABC-type glycerol-3-phosphate transport system substrate-binding protein
MGKRRVGFALIIVTVLVAFGVTRRNYTATTSDPGTVTLRVGHFTIDPSFRIFMDKAAAAYTRLHPHVRIKQLDVPRQVYPQWQRTQIVGDTAPEIMQFAFFNAGIEDMVMHRFMVLDTWAEKPNPYRLGDETPWKETFLDGLGSRDSYSDKLRAYFGIPLIMGGYRFFYNETMRETQQLAAAPWTYREFGKLARALRQAGVTDESGRAVRPLVASDYSSYSTFKMLFASVTQPLLFSLDRNYDLQITGRDTGMGMLEGRWNYHTEEVQAALHLMRETADLMNPGFEQLRKQDGVLQFVQSRGLGMGGAHIDVTYLKELAPFKVGESAFPVPDRLDPVYGRYVLGPVTELQGSSTLTFGVLRSPLQEQALDFLQFLTGTEMMALLRQETGWRVAVRDPKNAESLVLKPGYPDTLFDNMNSRGNILAYRQNTHLLFQSKDGPLRFAERMDAESPAEIMAWLKAQASSLKLTLQQQESAIIARWVLSLHAADAAAQEQALAGFLDVNNRQETEYLGIKGFVDARDDP